MNNCKLCKSKEIKKNGKIRGKQRYKCKECGYTYVLGDERVKLNEKVEAMVLLLYSTGKGSYRFIARLLGVSVYAVYSWIKRAGKKYNADEISINIKEIEIDEMWHYIQKKVINAGYLKDLIELQKSVSLGLQDKEILRQCISCIKSLNT
jgi:transposase-like protein